MVLCSCRTLVSLWASELRRPWNSFDRLRSSASVCPSLAWRRGADVTDGTQEIKTHETRGRLGVASGVFLTCRFFLSSSSSFRRAPAFLALSFILNTEYPLQTGGIDEGDDDEWGNKKKSISLFQLCLLLHTPLNQGLDVFLQRFDLGSPLLCCNQ